MFGRQFLKLTVHFYNVGAKGRTFSSRLEVSQEAPLASVRRICTNSICSPLPAPSYTSHFV